MNYFFWLGAAGEGNEQETVEALKARVAMLEDALNRRPSLVVPFPTIRDVTLTGTIRADNGPALAE